MPLANFDMRVSCCIRLGDLGAIHGLRQRGRPWVAAAQEVLALALQGGREGTSCWRWA